MSDPLGPAGANARLEGPAGAAEASADASLPPMPTDAPPGFFGGVPYLFAVLKARRARDSAIRGLQREVDAEQRVLEESLRDLGKAARAAASPPASAAQQLELLSSLEARRSEAEGGQTGLDVQAQAAQQRFDVDAAAQQQIIENEQGDVARLQGELAGRQEQLRQLQGQAAQHEKTMHQLEREATAKQARATKTEDAAEREVLTRASAEKGVQASDAGTELARVKASLDQLTGPIAELTSQLAAAKGRQQAAEQQLGAARRELEATRRQIDSDKRTQGMEITRLEREIAEQLLAVGTAVDTQRGTDPSFEELYSRIDAQRQAIEGKQTQSTELAGERDTYDRPAFKNGLILLGSAGGALLLLILLLAILL